MGKVTALECLRCAATFPPGPMFEGCPRCRAEGRAANVVCRYAYDSLSGEVLRQSWRARPPGLWRYAECLPIEGEGLSLGEGGTPLIEVSDRGLLGRGPRLFLKDESRNPTGSYKDRLSAVAVSRARELGHRIVTVASTGNQGASAAAYAARAGLGAVIFTTPDVPETVKTVMQAYGAAVLATPTPKDRWTLMAEGVRRFGWFPTGNYVAPPVGSNPYGIQGYKTIAFEIWEQMGGAVPDVVAMPIAYGDGLSGVWRGFQELVRLGLARKTPRMVAVERFGSVARALREGRDTPATVATEPTVAFSISVSCSTYQVLRAVRDSGGTAVTVTDDACLEMQRRLAGAVGLYAECASVATLAGLDQMGRAGELESGISVVAVLTSSGLKDPAATARTLPRLPLVEPTCEAVVVTLREVYGLTVEAEGDRAEAERR